MRIGRLAVLVVALACGVALGQPAIAQPSPEGRDALTVTTRWLADHLADPELVLLHVGDPDEYDRKHIPGARFARLIDFYPEPEADGLAVELPSAVRLHRTLRSLGVSDDSTIVVYFGRNWYAPTTRIIFTLTAAGLGRNTRLLDGGMPSWVRAGHPTTAEVPDRQDGVLSPLVMQPLVVDAAFIQSQASDSPFVLVDARTRPFYNGEVLARRDSDGRGHIPGAINIPYTEMFDATGALRPVAEVAALFDEAGVEPGDTVVAYCHAGLQATVTLLVARTLGFRVLLYDGSIEDWVLRRHLPLETLRNGGAAW